MGPEEGIEKLEEQVRGIEWDGTGVGYGVRGSRLEELTIRFEGETCCRCLHTPMVILTHSLRYHFLVPQGSTRGSNHVQLFARLGAMGD